MPLQATSGAASYDAFGGGVPAVPKYIEEYFSTFLYTDNGSTQTINNGIDLAGKGGFVWAKCRSAVDDHIVWDSARGTSNYLIPNKTNAQATYAATFNLNGVSIPSLSTGQTYTSWSWAKAPKFFDVVTYSGSSSTQNIAHNLGSVPGCIIVKRTSGVEDWFVYHTSLGNTKYLKLNTTGAEASGFAAWNNTSPTSTQFTVLGGRTEVNAAGSDYVAYLFAHNAGGFGLTGTDNVISCGTFTGTGGTNTNSINLGYEPQWVMFKSATASVAGDWFMNDVMRGADLSNSRQLRANLSNAEGSDSPPRCYPTATGFNVTGNSQNTLNDVYIYIAIRRGPMKVPTSGTSVFAQTSTTSSTTPLSVTTNFPVDMAMNRYSGTTSPTYVFSRLTGAASDGTRESVYLQTNSTAAETAPNAFGDSMVSNTALIDYAFLAGNSNAKIYWNFRRAPSFFDVVCDSTGGPTIYHNLGVAPQLIIAKVRNYSPQDWFVDVPALGSARTLNLNLTGAASSTNYISSPTATQFTTSLGGGGYNYVYYLFATCAGVSKVGSYTGTGTTLQIDCGFTGGARFVLIKRTSSTGDWYVWDTARGIVSGNDPYLLLNSTAAGVTNTDYIDTYSAGFEISSTAPAAINASGGTFIFLAIA